MRWNIIVECVGEDGKICPALLWPTCQPFGCPFQARLARFPALATSEFCLVSRCCVGRMFNEAKRKHEQSFAESGKAINEKVRLYVRVGHALIDARQKGLDPYEAPGTAFTRSVDEAERLAQPGEAQGRLRYDLISGGLSLSANLTYFSLAIVCEARTCPA